MVQSSLREHVCDLLEQSPSHPPGVLHLLQAAAHRPQRRPPAAPHLPLLLPGAVWLPAAPTCHSSHRCRCYMHECRCNSGGSFGRTTGCCIANEDVAARCCAGHCSARECGGWIKWKCTTSCGACCCGCCGSAYGLWDRITCRWACQSAGRRQQQSRCSGYEVGAASN